MSVIKEESDTPSDLETLEGYDLVGSEEKICLRDVKPLGPNVHITSSSLNETYHSSCHEFTAPDLSTVTVKLEIENADEKGCNVANHNASGPSPSIASYSGDSDELKFSTNNTLDSITKDQHKPISPVRKTIDDENWIKKEPRSPTDSSLTLSEDTIVIHSIVDDLVSRNVHLENDIAGKPLYSNNTPSVDNDFKGVKHEPLEEQLAAQQSGNNKSTVDEIQTVEMMVGKPNPKVIIQRLESKYNGNSCSLKKILPKIDSDTSSQGQKGSFVCWICCKKYVRCSTVKKHMIEKHPQSRDLCAFVAKANNDSDNDCQLVWFCPRKCEYQASEYNALSEHLVTCQRPDLLPDCNRPDNVENGNNSSLFEFYENHGGNTNAEELNFHTQKTEQASSIPGQALEDEMQTMEQSIDDIPTCQLCDSVFSTRLLLQDHLNDCHKEQRISTHRRISKIKCCPCNKGFTRSDHLHRQMRTHTGDKAYTCNHCNKSFCKRDVLNRHMRTHTGDKPYICIHCNKTFSRSGYLRKHITTHTGDKPFNCIHCNKTFSRRDHLRKHMRTHTGEKPYKCNHCEKSYSQSIHLHVHMRTHTGDKPYKCIHCDKTFSVCHNLNRHMRTHTGNKPYKCNHCKMSYCQRNHLNVHMRTHTGDKPYKCNHCDKTFRVSHILHVHMRTHTEDKPYKCNHCNKSFSKSDVLNMHMRTHTGDKPYICSQCNKSFSQSAYLHVHMKTHTGDKPYKCNHCNKSFSQIGYLHVHMRTHTGYKPYKCSHCNKSFSQSGDLTRHIRTHTGDKPYKCNQCNKSFSLTSSLHRHISISRYHNQKIHL